LLVFGDTAYVATTNHCGGVADGVWALDLPTAQVKNWKPEGGGIAGTVGPAAGPDGTLYVATTGGELVGLEPKTLKETAKQKVSGVEFTSSPVVFDFNGKNMIAVAANDGCLYLFDAAALSSPAVKSGVIATGFEPGSLTSWVDGHKNRWILASSRAEHGSVVATKVVSNGSGLALEEGWKSRELTAPLSPVVTNGVVFALASGEFKSTDPKVKLAKLVKNSTNAVLYALDGETGKELWNSGQQITSFVHSGGLAAGDTRVYLADYEGNEYAFGIPIEH
jgi:outer membrane protein assembly factor BamB